MIARLEPEVVAGNLLRVGIALTLYEILKYQVMDRVRSFYERGIDESGPLLDEVEYTKKVRRLDRSPYRASLLWLEQMEAIDGHDVEAVNQLHQYRNRMAHESGTLILDPSFEIEDDLIAQCRQVLDKVTRFWIGIDIDVDPELAGFDPMDPEIRVPVVDFFDHVHMIEREWQQQLVDLGTPASRDNLSDDGPA